MKDIVIIYHGECPDGFGAAWAAHKKFGDKAEYIPVHHNHAEPEGLVNKEIYFLDFAYSAVQMKELIKRNKKVTAIDHHIAREDAIKLTEDHLYSTDNSGAVLAWRYFHTGRPVPKMLEYIEDRDLWRFKIKESDPVCAFIDTYDFDFSAWDKLAEEIEEEKFRAEAVKRGMIMLEHENRLMDRMIAEGSRIVNFEGHEVYAINAPHFFASHIGSILYKKKPPFAIIWSEDKERVNVSLRSDGSVDVNELASKYKGGGHRGSAGFSIPSINSFPWKEKK
jgi:nanoRNase/pAp phosphatase (c-di-AMP/oligoRNAs hydrolase)